mmetsp:Transcript_45742/g.50986  ORF Transcript_45742/g.50986 Transcript_45742/m.50986 type:complete len:789 (+) Transcript_45742:81-2447(+)
MMRKSDRKSFHQLCFMIGVAAIFLSSFLMGVDAVISTAELLIWSSNSNDDSTKLSVSQASYGPKAPTQNDSNSDDDDRQRLVSPPANNPFLCQDADDVVINQEILESTKGAVMIIPRGGCTYEHKTWIAQTLYEASGVIVYNTLASRYTFNETDGVTIIWPLEYHDYDCDKAMAEIPSNELHFFSNADEVKKKTGGSSPYDWGENDQSLTGDTVDNLCKTHDENKLQNCPSKRCLVAHNSSDDEKTTADTTTVCCAWDLRLNPFADAKIDKNITITIPTIFATMEQGDILLKAMAKSQSSNDGLVTVSIHSFWRPAYNLSAVLIVFWGVMVAGIAAYQSADDYHVGISKLWRGKEKNSTYNINSNPASAVSDGNEKDNQQQESLVNRGNSLSDESLELEPIHALGFVIMSSISLFILFFFKIYNVAKVMYAFGCANSFIQIMVYPLLSRFLSSRLCRLKSSGKNVFGERLLYRSEDFGDFTNWDALAGVIGYSTGMVWLYMALYIPQAGDHYTFYWVAQDVLGLCMCVTFLGLIQLNSIRVASSLLIVAFFYDIFFVFVTPYLFKGRSVMIEVATSGGPPKADAIWCEQYSSDSDCKGGDPMPMLFSIPRLFDYQGGSSMLGLGDIVLPGLLLSFAARLDAARLVYKLYSGTKKNDLPPPMSAWYALLLGGEGYYFGPLLISYAIGLFMANAAVYLMDMGQPALLYLVPSTLGTIAYKGWKRSEVMSLWNGPKILKHADYVCYGRPSSSPSTEVDEPIATQEEFVDDVVGNAPLLSPNDSGSSRSNKK